MSYYDIIAKYKDFKWDDAFRAAGKSDVEKAIASDSPDIKDLLALLSPEAENLLEEMALKSRSLTLKNFGRTIQLYTPLYLSNYCDNSCLYCGFNSDNNIDRKVLTLEEVEKEALFISSTGLKHILILTGESRRMSPISYLKDCVNALKKYFSSISIEVYPLTGPEYSELFAEGADSLTIYQEVYGEDIYNNVHMGGPKNDYIFRLDAPERGAYSGMRSVNIGVLLGLGEWRREAFLLGLHAKYLQDKFPDVEIGVSVPRIRPQGTSFTAPYDVSDKNIVQIVLALRIFMPRLGLTLSTRERPQLRDNLIPLGITRMSAGSTTRVGGHVIEAGGSKGAYQFEISDKRSVDEVKTALEKKGYQPVFKDWVRI